MGQKCKTCLLWPVIVIWCLRAVISSAVARFWACGKPCMSITIMWWEFSVKGGRNYLPHQLFFNGAAVLSAYLAHCRLHDWICGLIHWIMGLAPVSSAITKFLPNKKQKKSWVFPPGSWLFPTKAVGVSPWLEPSTLIQVYRSQRNEESIIATMARVRITFSPEDFLLLYLFY